MKAVKKKRVNFERYGNGSKQKMTKRQRPIRQKQPKENGKKLKIYFFPLMTKEKSFITAENYSRSIGEKDTATESLAAHFIINILKYGRKQQQA